MRRNRWAIAGAGVLALALFAWSVTVVTASAGRRSLHVLCSSIDALCQQWAQGFTERTGVEVLMERLSTGEALARLSRGGDEFDVWHGGPADMYVVARSRELLQPYVAPAASAIPLEYRDPEGYWTGTYLGVLGFCSNVRQLADAGVDVPESWDDLLDRRLLGRVSVPNPVTSGTGYVWLRTQAQRLGSEDAAIAYAQAADAGVLQYTNSGLAPATVAGRGEAAVAVTFTQHCVRALDAGMGDLVVSHPREGSGFEIGAVAIMADAPDPAGARAYVDWAVSAPAQLGPSRVVAAQIPTRPDVPTDVRLTGGTLLPSAADAAASSRERLLGRFQREVHR